MPANRRPARLGPKTAELLALVDAGWDVRAPGWAGMKYRATGPDGEVRRFGMQTGTTLKQRGLIEVQRGTGRVLRLR